MEGAKVNACNFLLSFGTLAHTSPYANVNEGNAQVTQLWSGLLNEIFLKRHAYHVAFPADATPQDKIALVGSSILVDVALFENDDDGNAGN